MPEGDTIFRTARTLNRALAGQVVTGFETGLAPLARVNDDAPLAGRTVEKVEAKGKWCVISFSGDLALVTHMLMSGSWHLYRPGERWRLGRNRMRVVVRTNDWVAVGFDVPVAEFHTARTLGRHRQIPQLGPDLLAAGYTRDAGVARLKEFAAEQPEVEVGVALLNQRVLAGLGNVYKSEVAFAAGVNPFRAVSTLTQKEIEVMVDVARRWLKENVADGAGGKMVTYEGNRRTTGNSNRDDRLWVYRRQGQECRKCGAVIVMRKQGEQARSTYWCPECQRGTA
jgi:endonuclease-8